jgi:hypothetical protein
MFGNPDISATPVSDIYASQANVYGNSFQNPMNPANQNSGWNIDPSLLSPSYTAPYRPQYQGPNGASRYGHTGFFGGLRQLSPTSQDVMWGNPIMQQQQAIEDVSSRPFDALAWTTQRIALPIAGFTAARHITKGLGLGWGMGSRFGAGLGSGLASGFGATAPSFGGFAGTAKGLGKAYQAGGMWGAAASAYTDVGFKGAMNLAARGVMGTAFGAVASLAVPLVIGQGLTYGAEKGLIDPYINTRVSSKNLRENFAGITFGDAEGNAVTGGGLSNSESYKMAQQITHAGISDMTFSNTQYRQGADMMGRAGLMDNIGSKDIVKRVKDSMDQVKLIMAIANMPEMKDAIEQLAKLQQAGASIAGGTSSTASSTMRILGGHAAMAGTSVQRMMNTVGAQGQYLYSANGMTPYLGQIAAAGAYSSLAAGQRMGLLSTEQIARMGGLEGATQASLTGQINMSQTLFNKMALHNSFLGGGKGGSAYGNQEDTMSITSKFSENMVADPLGTYGGMMLHSRQMAGKQIEERGSLAVDDQVYALAKNHPQVFDKNGKISLERAVPFMLQANMSEDQIQAYAAQRLTETDPKLQSAKQKALDRNREEQLRETISQQGTYGGPIGSSIYALRKGGRAVVNGVSGTVVDPVTSVIGTFGDAIQRTTDWAVFGTTLEKNKNESINDYLTDPSSKMLENKDLKVFDMKKFNEGLGTFNKTVRGGDVIKVNKTSPHAELAEKLNDLAIRQNNQGAKNYFQAETKEERSAALKKVMASGDLGDVLTSQYSGFESRANLDDFLESRQKSVDTTDRGMRIIGRFGGSSGPVKEAKVSASEKLQKLKNDLSLASGMTGEIPETMQAAGLAYKIWGKTESGDINPNMSDTDLAKDSDVAEYAKLTGSKVNGDLITKARAAGVQNYKAGLEGVTTTAAGMNRKDYKTNDDFLKAVNEKNGRIYGIAKKNADSIDSKEAYNESQIDVNIARQKQHISQLLKEGRIDVSSAQNSINAIDQGRAIDKFSKAVDRFDVTVNKDNKKPTFLNSSPGEVKDRILGKVKSSDSK